MRTKCYIRLHCILDHIIGVKGKMMKIRIISIAVLLSFTCYSDTEPIPDTDAIDPDSLNLFLQDVLIWKRTLITLESIPCPEDISDLVIDRGINIGQVACLTFENFGVLLLSAEPVDAYDESISAWHYAPWHNVRFEVDGMPYHMSLFLGGRGFLTLPDGRTGAFSFDHPE